MSRAAFLVLVAACGSNPPPVPPPQAPPRLPIAAVEPEVATAAARPPGPLAVRESVPQTPPPVRQEAMRVNDATMLDLPAMREDLAAAGEIITQFVPRTARVREGQAQWAAHVPMLERLAPYSVASTAGALLSLSSRLPFCARPPAERWSCHPGWDPPPANDTSQPVYATGRDGDVTTLTVRDLSRADDPRWAGLAKDAAALDDARALVVDLRGAAGHDPRPLIPWLEKVTHRSPLAPLREIRPLPGSVDDVRAYAQRFRDAGRDDTVWQALVGTTTSKPVTARPIAVVIDQHCQAACELVARVLQTYAGATVTGRAGALGRIARDQPALRVLPRSKIAMFYFATEYVLSKDIEAATGPTDEWMTWQTDSVDDDGLAWAQREVRARLADPSWPGGCPARGTPPRAAIDGRTWLLANGCSADMDLQIEVVSTAPHTALGRVVRSCDPRAQLGGFLPGRFTLSPPTVDLVDRLAASVLVDRIHVRCEGRPHINAPTKW